MKFGTIVRFEFKYQLRHVSTWLMLLVFLLFGFGVLRLVTLTSGTYLNAPGTIAFFTVFGSAIWLVIGGVVAGDAATRDVHTRMHPLTFTTPVSKFSYLSARFLAALALNVLVMLVLYVGMLLSYYGPGARTQFLGPFRLASYLTNFAFIALPTVLVTTAIQFTCATLSGRAIASYIASIFIIIFSQFGGTTVRFALEWKVLGSLMDLLGTSIVAEMEGWTPIDSNTRLILLEGTWLWNRIMWLGIAAGALAFTYFRFRLAHITSNGGLFDLLRRRPASVRSAAQVSLETPHTLSQPIDRINLPNLARNFTFATYVRQVLAIAGTSFWSIAKSRGGLTLVAILAIGTGLFATEYMEYLGVPLLARTQEVLRMLTPPLSSYQTQWIIIPLLTIFYAGELIWREREAGLHELSDTTPVPEWVMFLGKFMGLALIITIWVGFLMLAGIINQLVMGYYHFEIGVYLKALFGIQLTNYLLFALLVFVIHVVVNQKYLGLIAAFGAYGYLLFSSMIGVEHNMLVYASDPGWAYSDMSGFGPFITPWLWFKFYWASWAFFLGVLATLFWVRSKEGGLTSRLHGAQHRLPEYKNPLALSLALVLVSGSFIFYNTNLANTYTTREDRMELRAEYERRYGQYENTPQPALARTKLHVEIYPADQAADIEGTYQLVNRSKAAIGFIHLSILPHLRLSGISFDRAATPVVLDEHHGYRIYTLKKQLAPGDSVQMSFKIQIKTSGFSNEGVDASVVANGTHIESDWMPVIGYNENRRLREARDREKYGLAPRPERPSLYDVEARDDTRHADPMNFE
ncbi:MAG: ABC transporter permease, partial [Bacteroidetes bacterium]|nr:ABC transporter permease [Bacteroidota bacterium]